MIKYRQHLDTKLNDTEKEFHYWGYINGQFVPPIGDTPLEINSQKSSGLMDFNGVDIYEGDKVQMTAVAFGEHDFLGVVKFYDGSFWIDNNRKAVLLYSVKGQIDIVGHVNSIVDNMEVKNG